MSEDERLAESYRDQRSARPGECGRQSDVASGQSVRLFAAFDEAVPGSFGQDGPRDLINSIGQARFDPSPTESDSESDRAGGEPLVRLVEAFRLSIPSEYLVEPKHCLRRRVAAVRIASRSRRCH